MTPLTLFETLLLLPFLLLMMVTLSSTSNASAPVVDAPWGRVQGVVLSGLENRTLHGFLGIPYAVPPVGDLRFEKPRPHPGPGEGQTFVAEKVAPACIQETGLVSKYRARSEDCLILDLYVPAVNSSTPRPVMFFIHGGGFDMGDSASYRSSRLVVDEDVVVVVIQYRLGFFGFLSTSDGSLTPNLGLWDQNLALTWVRDNIAAFGGDPGLVTIFGESAGGMSVGLHTLSPRSKGLFKRAILQSGSPSALLKASGKATPEVFANFSQALGCAGSTTQQMLACIKRLSAESFQAKASQFQRLSPLQIFTFPVVDGDFFLGSASDVLESDDLLSRSSLEDVETIIGFNNQEGSFKHIDEIVRNLSKEFLTSRQYFEESLYACFPMLGIVPNPILFKAASFHYLGEDYEKNVLDLQDTADVKGDCVITVPVIDWALQLAASPRTAPRYVYVLEHQFASNANSTLPGSQHGDDLFLLFDPWHHVPNDSIVVLLNKTDLVEDEMPLSAMFVKLFASFARSGTPQLTSPGSGTWPRFTNELQQILSITKSPKVVNNFGLYKKRWTFWSRFLPDLQKLISEGRGGQGQSTTQSITTSRCTSTAAHLDSSGFFFAATALALATVYNFFRSCK